MINMNVKYFILYLILIKFNYLNGQNRCSEGLFN